MHVDQNGFTLFHREEEYMYTEGAVLGVYGRTGQFLWIGLEILLAVILVRIVAWILGKILGCVGDSCGEVLFTVVGLGVALCLAIFFAFL